MDTLAVVINNKAKNVSSLTAYLDAFSKNSLKYTLYKTEPENLDDTIKQCMKKHSILLIGGGDGSIRSAAQLCVNSPVLLGVLPLGTLNHLSKELALPANPEELVQAISNKTTITIDLAEVNGMVFVNNSSIGFYPGFVKKREYYTKFYNKWLSYIPGLVQAFAHHETFSIAIKNKQLNISLRTSFLMVSNNLYSYQFPLNVKRESFDKAVLGIYFLKYGKLYLSKILRSLFSKKSDFETKISYESVEIEIKDRKKIAVSLDGETKMLENPLIYTLRPHSLTLLTHTI